VSTYYARVNKYVDAENGVDAPTSGSATTPDRRISYALTRAAGLPWTIRIAGRKNAAGGVILYDSKLLAETCS
jgi:hypothetical protein